MRLIQKLLERFTGHIICRQIHQHQMIIRPIRYDLDLPVLQALAKCLSIIDHTLLIFLKGRIQCLLKADSFRRDHMHQRPTLRTGEYSLVEVVLVRHFLARHDHTASGTTQRLMCSRRGNMRIRNRAWMQSCRHKPGNMCDIDHQYGPHFIRDLPEFLEIDRSCICRSPCHDHLRFTFQSDLSNIIIIKESFIIHSVRNTIKIFAGHIHR